MPNLNRDNLEMQRLRETVAEIYVLISLRLAIQLYSISA
jgi:hypothetical protein